MQMKRSSRCFIVFVRACIVLIVVFEEFAK